MNRREPYCEGFGHVPLSSAYRSLSAFLLPFHTSFPGRRRVSMQENKATPITIIDTTCMHVNY